MPFDPNANLVQDNDRGHFEIRWDFTKQLWIGTRNGESIVEASTRDECSQGVDLLIEYPPIEWGDFGTHPYLIMVYYSRAHLTEVAQNWGMTPSSELYDTAQTLDIALQVAQGQSMEMPDHEFAVEGGEFEPGGWENPLFKGGKRIR